LALASGGLGDAEVVDGGRRLEIGGIRGVLVERNDHGPVMADGAVLETPVSQPDGLERAQRNPDRREQMIGAATHRTIKAFEHVPDHFPSVDGTPMG
jgi:hypothetical protein